MHRLALASALLLLTTTCSAQIVSRHGAIIIPFIGCPADGQLGPEPAPRHAVKMVHLAPNFASQLAWYQGRRGPGVFGPRGWSCFTAYGSSGETVYVTPTKLTSAEVLKMNWKGLYGAAIQLSRDDGGTSGRFGVAERISAVFPAYLGFVQAVLKEGF